MSDFPPRPTLCLFAISHFCEKARWGLDHLGVEYDLLHLAPVAHFERMKVLGAPGSSVPALVGIEPVVQGSSAILDWADSRFGQGERTLTPSDGTADEWRALETRLDEVVGVHVRRAYYSEALVHAPEQVLPIMMDDLPPEDRAPLAENWEVVARLMMGSMNVGIEQGRASVEILERELDWFDGLLADGRPFLLGDRFSRLDLTAASMWAAIAQPEAHPTYHRMHQTSGSKAMLERMHDRPAIVWTRSIYAGYR